MHGSFQRAWPAWMLGVCLLAWCGTAQAQVPYEGFDDLGSLYRGPARKAPEPIRLWPHVMKPEPRLQLGDVLRLHPYYALQVLYDDNILLTDAGDQDAETLTDVLFRNVLGSRLDLYLGDHLVSARYQATYEDYTDTGRFDNWQHRVDVTAKLNWERFYVRASNRYEHRTDARFAEEAERITYDVNTTKIWAGYAEGDFELKVGFTHYNLDFDQREGLQALDLWEATGWAQVNYQFAHKNRILFEYNYTFNRFDESQNNDYEMHGYRAGVYGEIARKFLYVVKLGGTDQHVSSRGENPDNDEADQFVAEVGLHFLPWEGIRFSAGYRRKMVYSFTSNFASYDLYYLQAEQQLCSWFALREYGSIEHYDPSQTHSFLRGRVGIGGIVSVQDYLQLALFYEYRRQDTDVVDREYDNNRLMFSAMLAF